jgi:hypothetical protein
MSISDKAISSGLGNVAATPPARERRLAIGEELSQLKAMENTD